MRRYFGLYDGHVCIHVLLVHLCISHTLALAASLSVSVVRGTI